MAELILNDRVQVNRKDKMAEIKTQQDADHGPNVAALLAEFHKAKAALTQKHSFRSIGAFEADAYNLEGRLIIFETMMLTRAIDWVARLSIDPRAEIRRGTIAVFFELQSAYTRVRLNALFTSFIFISTMMKSFWKREFVAACPRWERLISAAVNPTGGVTQKKHNIAAESQSIATLVEEMLAMAKQSYSAALTAFHMGHLAFEHTLTIAQLRYRRDQVHDIILWFNVRYSELALAYTIADRVKPHVHCLGPLLLDRICGNTDGTGIITHDDGRGQRVSKVGNNIS
jgi:hypothetical protein